MTIYNRGNIKGEKGDKGDSVTGPTGPVGVGIKSIEQITYMKFKFCLTDGSEYIINYGDEPTFDDITVTSTNDILSYADGDSTVLSAQLTNQGQAVSVSGESVTFEVRKVSDDSLVETLTDTTDSNGEASVEYFGKGTGDLYVNCRCRTLSKTYSTIQDYLYVPKLDGTESIYQMQGTTTIANGEMSGGSGYLTTAFLNSNNWELSFDGKLTNAQCGFWIIKSDETQRDKNDILIIRSTIYTHVNGSGSETTLGRTLDTNYHHFKITKNGNNFTLVIDDLITVNFTWSLGTTLNDLCIGVDSWGGVSTIKNIVVKPL